MDKSEKERLKEEKRKEKVRKQWRRAKEKYVRKKERRRMFVNYSGEHLRRWSSLDNTAHIFPVVAGEGMANVFRYSFFLDEEVNRLILDKAIHQVLPYFKTFHSRLRRGFFWYYFEENRKRFPRVQEEEDIPCRYFAPNTNHDFLFRVSYFKNKINFEIYHAVADGSGAAHFTLEIMYHYLRMVHPELKEFGEGIDPGTSLNTEDAFLKNYKKKQKAGYNKEPAYCLTGPRLEHHMTGLIHGRMPLFQVKEVARRYGVTINEYLVAAFMYSIYTEAMHKKPHRHPVAIAVPVNLRPYYDSDTLRNFFVMVSARFAPEGREHRFEDVIRATRESLEPQMTKENLESIFSYGVTREKNPFLRVMPQVIKQPVMKMVYQGASRNTTATMSNIGGLKVREEYRPYITDFVAFLSRSYGQELKAVISSYNEILTISFSSTLKNPAVQRGFFRQLAQDGIDVAIETNHVYNPSADKG